MAFNTIFPALTPHPECNWLRHFIIVFYCFLAVQTSTTNSFLLTFSYCDRRELQDEYLIKNSIYKCIKSVKIINSELSVRDKCYAMHLIADKSIRLDDLII